MNWKLVYLPEAAKDLKNLAGNQRLMVIKAICKVLQNPLPVTEGGYGKPLGNKQGSDLTGFLKNLADCLNDHQSLIPGKVDVYKRQILL